jgi:dienelactone hydrolase
LGAVDDRENLGKASIAALEIMKWLCLATCLLPLLAPAEVTSLPVKPSATDPEIKQFDEPHWIYLDREIVVEQRADRPPPRQELLLWLTGTGGKGHDAQGFSNRAASLGYHVITLMFPNAIPATACAGDSNSNAFEAFRMAIIQGGRATYQQGRQELTISRAESIENRLIKALQFLQQKRPKENWAQFLNEDGTVKWPSIAVAGQSQGGGYAALIGIKHRVARVLCFGAPKDYSKRLNAPAAWYGQESATPKDRFFAFNHRQDPKGCTPEQLLSNLQALGLDAFGRPVEVDTEPFPYREARILYTRYPEVTVTGVESEGAKIAHGSAILTKYADRWKQVWTYLLTQ